MRDMSEAYHLKEKSRLEEVRLQTEEDLREKEPAEWIDGRIYEVVRPKRWHNRIVKILKEIIKEYQRKHPEFCEVRTAPFGVRLIGNGDTYLMPDLCVVIDRRKLAESECVGAPEMVIEVVSPETQYMDYWVKLARYRSAGVKEYWIVDRDWDHGYVYYFEDGEMDLASFSGRLKSRVCEGLVFDFSRLKRRR